MEINELRFGTAGIPISTPETNTLKGVRYVRELGLDGMELEFVRRVNITEDKTAAIKKAATEKKVVLTCHAPYYINLNSLEEIKIKESKERIIHAARIAWLCGAKAITFHAGFYMKKSGEETYQQIKKGVEEIIKVLRAEGNEITIRPETTGKGSQWGSLKEILRLSKEVEGVMPCIDFSHLFAREIGKVNSQPGFRKWLEKVEKVLGRKGLDNMHIHMSGIEYGPKGEKWHLTLGQSEFKWKELLEVLKSFDCKGIVISESPNIEDDALMMQKFYRSL